MLDLDYFASLHGHGQCSRSIRRGAIYLDLAAKALRTGPMPPIKPLPIEMKTLSMPRHRSSICSPIIFRMTV